MLVVEGVEDIRCGVEEHLEEEEGLEEEGEAEGEEVELGSGGNQLIANMMEKMFSKDFQPDSTQTWMYSHGHIGWLTGLTFPILGILFLSMKRQQRC